MESTRAGDRVVVMGQPGKVTYRDGYGTLTILLDNGQVVFLEDGNLA